VSRAVRLGAVDYLNARPLVYGLEADAAPTAASPDASSLPALSVRFDLPAACAALLDNREIDLGLIPSIAYFDRPEFRAVPGIGIISDGPVASVAIFTKRPLREVRSLALDTSSRTSVALTRVLCARIFEIAPRFVPHGPNLTAMLDACDAALLIGDPALFADHAALGAEKIDLGRTWTERIGRPFVWAFWVGRADAADASVVERLQGVRDAGIAASDRIANDYCDGDPDRQAVARAYLRENIKYGLSDAALEGLRTFYREAAALDLITRAESVRFFDAGRP
jgi:chorismate dehydratase